MKELGRAAHQARERGKRAGNIDPKKLKLTWAKCRYGSGRGEFSLNGEGEEKVGEVGGWLQSRDVGDAKRLPLQAERRTLYDVIGRAEKEKKRGVRGWRESALVWSGGNWDREQLGRREKNLQQRVVSEEGKR